MKLIRLTLVGLIAAAVAVPSSALANSSAPVRVPAGASEVRPLGLSFDSGSNRLVEGYAIVHYRKGGAKGGGQAKPARTQCYGFLAKDAKWKSVEPWVVNPSNASGLDGGFVASNLTADIAKWESAAGANILGDGTVTADVLAGDTASPDNVNEVYFADVAEPGAIGITIVWGIFSGPTFQRELVEWDQIYDDVDYGWSDSGAAGAMDFENIATHELGHSVGLGDLYTSACASETMYGYASFGETQKRDLHTGDIAGIAKLY